MVNRQLMHASNADRVFIPEQLGKRFSGRELGLSIRPKSA